MRHGREAGSEEGFSHYERGCGQAGPQPADDSHVEVGRHGAAILQVPPFHLLQDGRHRGLDSGELSTRRAEELKEVRFMG